ncbi:hypothetical protein MY04_0144 [Flammeovirga sp. MY04]|uniref:hypothetical protein n=1 Tax=Flammeovirga sp. MY04 TaxID=1191459 RepID=UPI0008061DA1|nr:hypothetical protein [Flammeovirga sp. MY04]ANQ47526.1 hypothetical protein MY04_0144 [Flammeovirga sp. MY04]
MKFIKKCLQFFKRNPSVNYIDDEIDEHNIEDQFQLLENAYKQLHQQSPLENLTTHSLIDVHGNYAVEGHNPWDKSSKYTGALSIEKSEQKYSFDWAVGISNLYQKGEGQIISNYLKVDFVYKDNEHTFKGLVIYKQIDEESMAGFWIEEGIFDVGFERLTLKNKGFQ